MSFNDKFIKPVGRFIKRRSKIIIAVLAVIALGLAVLVCIRLFGDIPDDNPLGEETSASSTSVPTEMSSAESSTLISENATGTDITLSTPDHTESGTDPYVPTESTTGSTTEEPYIEPDFPLLLLRIAEDPVEVKNDDGIVLVSGSIQVPVFSNNNDNPVITKINNGITQYLTEIKKTNLKKLKKTALEDLASSNPCVPFFYNITADVMLSSDLAVSVLFTEKAYTGGEFNATNLYSVCYSTDDGEAITFESLFGSSRAEAEEYIISRVLADIKADAESYYPDVEGLIELYGTEGRWYLGEDGINIYYVPYEIASFKKGVSVFSIPYGDFIGKLLFNPAYISDQ